MVPYKARDPLFSIGDDSDTLGYTAPVAVILTKPVQIFPAGTCF